MSKSTSRRSVASLTQFISEIKAFPNLDWVYRGQTDASFPLIPKAGRPEFFRPANEYWSNLGQVSNDLGPFNAWRQQAVAFSALPEDSFECLALAQHYGLATRLLDWTTNPLVALFFAVENKNEVTGAVYCYLPPGYIDPDEETLVKCSRVGRYTPRPFDRRILAQSGLFTYHPNPMEELIPRRVTKAQREFTSERLNLVRFSILGKFKNLLQGELKDLGISRKTLFPDLEGLSGYINWLVRTNRRWKAIMDTPRVSTS